jgi:hypothetical protein
VCETCGDAPAYWQLKDSILTPYLPNTAKGQSTVNMPLEQGKVNFVTGDESSLVKSSTYCVVVSICIFSQPLVTVTRDGRITDVFFKQNNSSAGTDIPAFLAVGGDTESFSICSFIGTRGHSSRRDVYFKQTSTGIASNCQPAHLVIDTCP